MTRRILDPHLHGTHEEPETPNEIAIGPPTELHWYQLAARDTVAEAGVERVEERLELRIEGPAPP
jgi:hypothetical protein